MRTFIINTLCLLLLLVFCDQIKAQGVAGFEYQKGKKTVLPSHPRLFFSKKEEAKILKLAKENDLLAKLIKFIGQRAEDMLDLPLLKTNSRGEIDLSTSRKAIKRIGTLSLAYRLFDDERFTNKVEKELLNIASFKSWHPEHFLDTAEMTTAVSIGYDWCYDQLSKKTKKAVESAIVNKAFDPAWPVYKHGNQGSWAKRNTNWNLVTNTGLATGALAIAEKYPDKARRIIQYAADFTPNNIKHYAPNGVYYEGPAYWNYSTMYLSLLLDNFYRILGDDFGLSDMQGVSKTAKYYINTLSPTNGVFNFADASGTNATLAPIYFFFSKKFNQPEVADFYRSYLSKRLRVNMYMPRFFFLAIPWFDDVSYNGNMERKKMQVFEGEPDIIAFNGGKGNENGLFLIAKGGKPDMPHNQMDVGSFVVEDQGIRWGVDLGSENYDLPGFWDYEPGGKRWTYFRNNNLSHNTINIDGKVSNPRGYGELDQFDLSKKKPFAILDMSSIYKNQADSVMRGFKMLSPNLILIRDEIKPRKGAQKINWRFFTKADVTISNNIVELEQEGKKFYLKAHSNKKAIIKVMDAESKTPGTKPIKGVRMVEVSIEAGKNNWIDISILMGRNKVEIKSKSVYSISSMAQW